MPVKLKSVEETQYLPPPLRDGCVYKIIAGYQVGWSFVKTKDNTIHYLSNRAGVAVGWDMVNVLSKPDTRYVEVTLQEV